jgi:hypothetical protein
MFSNPSLSRQPSAASSPHYSEILAALTADKWQVVSEGPSGAQLKQPRVMLTQTKVAIVAGAVLVLFYWPVALLLLILGVIDYVMTKERSFFLSRERPDYPPKK